MKILYQLPIYEILLQTVRLCTSPACLLLSSSNKKSGGHSLTYVESVCFPSPHRLNQSRQAESLSIFSCFFVFPPPPTWFCAPTTRFNKRRRLVIDEGHLDVTMRQKTQRWVFLLGGHVPPKAAYLLDPLLPPPPIDCC